MHALRNLILASCSQTNYSSWSPGFPQQEALVEHCTLIGYEQNEARVNDYSCDARRPVLCERSYNASKNVFFFFVKL